MVIASFLEDMDCPCSCRDLVDLAEDNHAPEEVLDLLEMLPDRRYGNIFEVMAALARI